MQNFVKRGWSLRFRDSAIIYLARDLFISFMGCTSIMIHRSQSVVRLAGLAMTALAGAVANAEVFELDTTEGPIWERPQVSGTSSSGEFVSYIALPFAVSTSGDYTITATPQVNNFDLVQFLYDATFNPITPLVGYLTGYDTYSVGDAEQFQFSLTSGATYYAVTTGVAGFYDFGPYSLSITGPGAVTVVEPSAVLPGDFTENEIVNVDDLLAWKDGFGDPPPASHLQGDADGDLDVDGNDFLIWQRDLGGTVAVAAVVASIPEPSAVILFFMATLTASSALRSRPPAAIPRSR
jgi:hypothetical protein